MTTLGLVALLAGAGLLVAEAHVPSAGVLGGAGVASLVLACWLLVVAAGGGLAVALPAAVIVLLAGAVSLVAVAARVRAAGRRAVPSGLDRLRGSVVEVRSWRQHDGQVAADGTLWRARLAWGEDDVPRPGSSVVVEDVDNLTLLVRPAEPWEHV